MKGLEEEEEDANMEEKRIRETSGEREDEDRWGKVAEKRERERDGPPTLGHRECALLGAFTRAKRDVGEPCVSK